MGGPSSSVFVFDASVVTLRPGGVGMISSSNSTSDRSI
jgi:hypothetical protein